ncbi:MAG: hypothetical protein CBB68_08730 [Rhodospirillaceae bacterium TMED8]|nr:hypothetical protein [Magnetovibrio sp.]OUT50450.1 MAG: hypothetical protein CBB68_08730 [Rhodospirillaceae bacterium TMED8]|tara:strand:- start:1198 stop:1788 length:591 start_codon:yes stop_codon:yes gene_type:complete
MLKTAITREDIMDLKVYANVRKKRRAAMTEKKKSRRLHCGPHATFSFENFDTMWHQVHEMLFIEKGGPDQIEDELTAYNPLVPNGSELTATLMFEIENPVIRANFLSGLGGIEETIFFDLENEIVRGIPEEDVDRTNAEGKASSVQFLHFPFTAAQITKFCDLSVRVGLAIEHDKYSHVAVLPANVREALGDDFAV